MAFSLLTLPEQQQVEECVITITRQKPETLFSFIKQIGHMLAMVSHQHYSVVATAAANVSYVSKASSATIQQCLCFVTTLDEGKHDSF